MPTKRGNIKMLSLSKRVHEVWLVTLMAGFMSKNGSKLKLYDISDIMFRHFTWIENDLIKSKIDYDYDRDMIPVKVEKLSVILNDINLRLSTIELELIKLEDRDLAKRVESDIKYIKFLLLSLPDESITAFNTQRKLDNIELNEEATDALTLFLFEEGYKEYELIMIYNYLKANSNDGFLNRIFSILIDESFFHLKSFGDMMAKMGILGVPRVIHKELYKVTNVVEFLKDGINEELLAKEECKKLADAVSSDSQELAKFFDFINHQENYHIALMKEALEYYTKEKNV
jgi:hypothetical protein